MDSVQKITSVKIDGKWYGIGDIVDLQSRRSYNYNIETFRISIIFKKGTDYYFGKRNPFTGEYYGNSGSDFTILRHTTKKHYLKLVRKEKLERLYEAG